MILNYLKFSIRSRHCIILDSKFSRLVLELFQQELNITPKPTKNKNKEALKATQAKKAKGEKSTKGDMDL